MKINEKSLSDYACFSDGIDKEGFLDKKGEVNHSYRKRWFALKGNLLFYFEKPGDKQPLGVIIVENCSVEICDSERFSFCIRFQDCDGPGSSRTYVLVAESEMEMEKWMKAITSSSYNYAEMVVKEFEKTLHRLKSETEDFCSHKMKKKNTVENEKSRLNTKVHKSKSVKSRYNTAANEKQRLTVDTLLLSTCNLKKGMPSDIKRSKSSENINRIQSSRSPQLRRRKNETNKCEQTYDQSAYDSGPEDSEKSTFEYLHSTFGAVIWTKILT